MCGIVGYVGPQNATPILMDGLARLEYRGYDSAGIAVVSDSGGLEVRKATGKLLNLRTALLDDEPAGTLGIGHTRWATHGRPSDGNAHPHLDCTGDVTVVHNGIIENYASLRDNLIQDGHHFRSETDTEVLAHLIEAALAAAPGTTLTEAVRLALLKVTGSYAIVVVSRQHRGELVGARLNGPLIIGLGHDENFIASDIPAILRHTRDIVVLEEGEIATVTASGYQISDLRGQRISRTTQHVDWDLEAAEKGGFPHFFVKEIHEQPHAMQRALLGRLRMYRDVPRLRLDELDSLVASGALDRITRIAVLGCGTSVHAGMFGKLAIERWARIPVEVNVASEYRYGDPIVGPETLCIAISQSGETADTLAATRLAREMGSPVIALTNVVGSAITRVADAVLYLQAGPEISVTATKTFVTMVTVLYLLAMWLGERSGKLPRLARKQIATELLSMPDTMNQLLERLDKDSSALEAVVAVLAGCQSCMFIGRGAGYPLALEAALKLKEISYVHAEAYPAGELKHGPIALLDPDFPLLAIATASRTYDKMISNIQEVRARGTHVIAVATNGDRLIDEHADELLRVPEASELFSPLLAIIPLQLLAYHVALARGCDIDQPRHLAKSVTVE